MISQTLPRPHLGAQTYQHNSKRDVSSSASGVGRVVTLARSIKLLSAQQHSRIMLQINLTRMGLSTPQTLQSRTPLSSQQTPLLPATGHASYPNAGARTNSRSRGAPWNHTRCKTHFAAGISRTARRAMALGVPTTDPAVL